MLRRLVERVRPERLLHLRKPTEALGARRQARGFTADAKVEIPPPLFYFAIPGLL
jgi:hypothetical protein